MADLVDVDPKVRRRLLRRLVWLGENAPAVVHHRLVNMPDDLAGLCRIRVGDYRILYWVYPKQTLLRIYRIQHRREVCRGL